MDIVEHVSLALGIIIFISVVSLIIGGKLKERYSLLWITICAFIIVFASSRRLLEFVSSAVGIYYPPSLLFLLGVLFLLILNISFSIALSTLTYTNDRLAQEVALLRKELEELKMENSPK